MSKNSPKQNLTQLKEWMKTMKIKTTDKRKSRRFNKKS